RDVDYARHGTTRRRLGADAAMSERKAHEHYRRGLGTALRHNQVAYSYSATTTALFGVISDESGAPNVGQCFLFIVGAGLAFAILHAATTQWFSKRLPREPTEVVALGTAISLFSMASG